MKDFKADVGTMDFILMIIAIVSPDASVRWHLHWRKAPPELISWLHFIFQDNTGKEWKGHCLHRTVPTAMHLHEAARVLGVLSPESVT